MKVEPPLEAAPDDPKHRVACLLPHETRRDLWRSLREGKSPVEARAHVMQDVAAEGSAVQATGDTGARGPIAPAEEDQGA
jgi:hypothetical protein